MYPAAIKIRRKTRKLNSTMDGTGQIVSPRSRSLVVDTLNCDFHHITVRRLML